MADNRDLVKRQFGAHADRYVASVHHATGESLDRLVALVAPRPEWRALDVATGGGHTALALAPLVREVVATDLTPKMLKAAEEFLRSRGVTNARFREADARYDDAIVHFRAIDQRVEVTHVRQIELLEKIEHRVVAPFLGQKALVAFFRLDHDRLLGQADAGQADQKGHDG
jgi:protein-L-isoaspartate O-methyltransferase